MPQKPSIPKGTRDFSPLETARRNYIFDTIKGCFRLFGYKQIETPAMENLSTLMGKYGDEGDKLLFKILNSGDFLKKTAKSDIESANLPALTRQLCEKGLRYDLTVPFARFVVQHRSELTMPFKRFQIQPVWRADRPQKGRYREFYQCDADIVGSDSLLNEVELLQLEDMVFSRLGIGITVKINNRKVLAAIAEMAGEPDRITDITVAIDKLDKTDMESVMAEMHEKGISPEATERLRPVLELSGTNAEKIATLRPLLRDTALGTRGLDELEFVTSTLDRLGHRCNLEIDFALARGLNYYTGTIIEVKANDAVIGSISGGGRYDNLTGVFGMDGLSGVGISFGADRIYDVMEQLRLFPDSLRESVSVMFVNFGEREAVRSLQVISRLRSEGVAAELYPDAAKLKKQFAAADSGHVPYTAIIGESELADGTIQLKDMQAGTQKKLTEDELIDRLTK